MPCVNIRRIMAYDSQSALASGRRNLAAEQALKQLICSSVERFRRRVTQPSHSSHVLPAMLVSFGELDGHLCAFPVVDTAAKDVLTLIPDERRMLAGFFGLSDRDSDLDSDDMDSALLRVPWSALFKADLRVFALLHDHQYEQRRRIKQWWPHSHDSISKHEYKFALSVASLSNIVILCGLSHRRKMELTLEFVEQDFSTTDHAIGKSEWTNAGSEGLLVQQVFRSSQSISSCPSLSIFLFL